MVCLYHGMVIRNWIAYSVSAYHKQIHMSFESIFGNKSIQHNCNPLESQKIAERRCNRICAFHYEYVPPLEPALEIAFFLRIFQQKAGNFCDFFIHVKYLRECSYRDFENHTFLFKFETYLHWENEHNQHYSLDPKGAKNPSTRIFTRKKSISLP